MASRICGLSFHRFHHELDVRPDGCAGPDSLGKTPCDDADSDLAHDHGPPDLTGNRRAMNEGRPASELISERIAELGDWRGETLGRMRKLIRDADPDVVEEWKWMGTPVWSHDGIICTGESYKKIVKLTFARGASLKDPARLFNSSLDGNVRRAIDIREGEAVDESAFKALVRQAVALNSSGKSKPPKKAKSR